MRPVCHMQRQEDGVSRLKRVILIGDHHQLPPVVKNMAFQKYSHLDQSLFTRFVRLGTPYVQLNAQVKPRCSCACVLHAVQHCACCCCLSHEVKECPTISCVSARNSSSILGQLYESQFAAQTLVSSSCSKPSQLQSCPESFAAYQ